MITWRELWVETTTRLGGAANDARWICEEITGTRGIEWMDQLDLPVGERAIARLDAMVARRLAGEPLQYVLGAWAFRSLELMVDRRVLIPRPETEEVAGVALELARTRPSPRVVADLGTGSGAIGLSLADELPLDGTTVWLTDRSSDALDVARANLAGLGRSAANVSIAEGSWFDALPAELRGRLDLVVSNPPYIAVDDPELDESVAAWEPLNALHSGPDGLDDVREIVAAAPGWLAPGGWLVLEIGHRQGDGVRAMLVAAGLDAVEVRRDAAGLDRIAVGRRSPG